MNHNEDKKRKSGIESLFPMDKHSDDGKAQLSFIRQPSRNNNSSSLFASNVQLPNTRTFEDFANEANGTGSKVTARNYINTKSKTQKKKLINQSATTTSTSSSCSNSHVDRELKSLASRGTPFQTKSSIEEHRFLKPTMQTKATFISVNKRAANHCIQAIRRGIPPNISLQSDERNLRSASSQELKISENCICRPNRRQTGEMGRYQVAKSWLFSCAVITVCVICPILSFVSDIVFYGMCSHLDATTQSLYQSVQSINLVDSTTNFDGFTKPGHLIKKRQLLRHQRREHLNKELPRLNHTKFQFEDITEQNAISENYTSLYKSTSSEVVAEQAQICNSKNETLKFMNSSQAQEQLRQYEHFVFNVFLPVLVVGTFPSFLLCIFVRLVILTTQHDHFLSAYVMNIISMSLQIILSPISIYIFNFFIGNNGFNCWHCALQENCPSTYSLNFVAANFNYSLLTTLCLKVVDSIAGGIIVFVVLCRIIWKRHRNKIVWWYLGRFVLTILAFIFCIISSPLMVMTPTIAVIRKEILGKMQIEEKVPISLTIFIVGISIWTLSVGLVTLFITYRTYVYYRVEDLGEKTYHDR